MGLQIITRMLKQTACYWAPGPPGADGRPAYADPVQIKCRWEVMETEVLDASGRTSVVQDRVYTDRDVKKGGALRLIALADMSDDEKDDPFSSEDTLEIKKFAKIPDLKARKFLRFALC